VCAPSNVIFEPNVASVSTYRLGVLVFECTS
jgi:hypothetical protein